MYIQNNLVREYCTLTKRETVTESRILQFRLRILTGTLRMEEISSITSLYTSSPKFNLLILPAKSSSSKSTDLCKFTLASEENRLMEAENEITAFDLQGRKFSGLIIFQGRRKKFRNNNSKKKNQQNYHLVEPHSTNIQNETSVRSTMY